MNKQTMPYERIKHKYITEDFSNCSLFDGDYLNFGYWKNISSNKSELTSKNRKKASKDLYNLMIDNLNIKSCDIVADLGSGKGYGSALIAKKIPCEYVIGIDLLSEHTEIARKIHNTFENIGKLQFITAPIERTLLPQNSIDKLLSVECIQHCYSIKNVFREMYRIMKSGGALAMTTFFAEDDFCTEKLKDLIPTLVTGVDSIVSIKNCITNLEEVGFKHIKCYRIGNYVWESYNKWILTTNFRYSWDLNWLLAYKKNLIDYYVITANK